MSVLKMLADENIANAVVNQLTQKGVEIGRVLDFLSEGTPDPEVIEFAYQNGYTLLTHDEHIIGHITNRHQEGKQHAGVFVAGHHLQGPSGIGTIVITVVEYHDLIAEGAATIQDDIHNQIIYI